MNTMTAAKAREIIRLDKAPFAEIAKAKGYLEGYNSKEVLERPEVLALVDALLMAHKALSDTKYSGGIICSDLEMSLSRYKEAVKR